ncbi:MAG TPA: hypothetical protein VGL56_11470 [Fimbriimonadaceae bacterium]
MLSFLAKEGYEITKAQNWGCYLLHKGNVNAIVSGGTLGDGEPKLDFKCMYLFNRAIRATELPNSVPYAEAEPHFSSSLDGTVTAESYVTLDGTNHKQLGSKVDAVFEKLQDFQSHFVRQHRGREYRDDLDAPRLVPPAETVLRDCNQQDTFALLKTWGWKDASEDSETSGWVVPVTVAGRLIWLSDGGSGNGGSQVMAIATIVAYPSSEIIAKKTADYPAQFSDALADGFYPTNNLWIPINLSKGVTAKEVKKEILRFVAFADSVDAKKPALAGKLRTLSPAKT